MSLRVIAQFLLDRGVAFVSPDYRLTQHGFNASHLFDDAFDAVRYLAREEASLNIDMTRSVVSGNSAGGHLALMVGYAMPVTVNDTTVQGVAALWPVVPEAWPLDRRTKGRPSFDGGFPWMREYMSPSTHIRPSSPPTLLIHGASDAAVPIAASHLIAEKLANVSVKHQLAAVPGAQHACDIEPFAPCATTSFATLQYFLHYVFNRVQPGGGK